MCYPSYSNTQHTLGAVHEKEYHIHTIISCLRHYQVKIRTRSSGGLAVWKKMLDITMRLTRKLLYLQMMLLKCFY